MIRAAAIVVIFVAIIVLTIISIAAFMDGQFFKGLLGCFFTSCDIWALMKIVDDGEGDDFE